MKVKIYTLTEKQLAQIKKECTDTAVDYAFMYLVGMSVKILHEQFGFGMRKRLPKFAEEIIDEYERYLEGDTSPEEYKELIYEQCGVKFELTELLEDKK